MGLFNDSSYDEVSSVDGRTLRGPLNVGVTPYGCLIDSQNRLFSADLGTGMVRLNTVTGVSGGRLGLIDQNYSIALDNQFVYFAGNSRPYFRVNKDTFAQSDNAQGPDYFSVGISVDGNGDIVTGAYNGSGVTKYLAADGAVICTNTGYANMVGTRGVIADADGNIWQISVSGSLLGKFGPNCEKLGSFPVGNSPYTYSDVAGLAARSITTRTGDWNVVYDSNVPALTWGRINWQAALPSGSGLAVAAQASDNQALLSGLPFAPVTNGTAFAVSGRFIEMRVRFTANDAGSAPVLAEIAVNSLNASCDVDLDDDIDVNDLRLIRAGISQPAAADDARDGVGNGVIDVRDVRACTLRCTRASCAAN